MNHIVILIPAYQPDERFPALAEELRRREFDVLVVDDGSRRSCRALFDRAEELGIPVVHHKINRGKGSAIKTGIAEIMRRYPDVTGIITADCDGQHDFEDIGKLAAMMRRRPDAFIIGCRSFEQNIPLRSKIGNLFTRQIYRIFTGIRITDTQSGLRGLPSCLFQQLLMLGGERYDYEMNMLLRLKNWNVSCLELPIKTIYYGNNEASHYRTILDSYLIMKQFIRMIATSLLSLGVDYLLYILLINLFALQTAFCYITARVFSSLINYTLNSRLVFKSGGSVSFFRYYLLAFFIMITGSLGTSLLVSLGVGSVCSKILIDLPLFFVSYLAQKKFVFAPPEKNLDRT